jgi:hypothetical protein
MTPEDSRKLKPGDRVIFDGYKTDTGTVRATSFRYVAIKWRDEHESFTGHDSMDRVSLAEN